MPKSLIIMLIILAVLIIALVVLYFLGKKAQKKQDEQQAQIDAMKQSISMLIIDKKKLKMKDAGLPSAALSQAPWFMKNSKLPIVKAKVGPQVMNLVCDAKIFDDVPVKKEVKAVVSGIYITEVKGLHGKSESKPQKKKSAYRKFVEKIQEKGGATPLK